AFVVILLVTASVIALVARDWDRHSTYEERELARARKRAEKWERGKDARARDRARWEAHQARQAEKRARLISFDSTRRDFLPSSPCGTPCARAPADVPRDPSRRPRPWLSRAPS